MRIGTFNLDGKWSSAHRDFLEGEHCDVWLLTEVHVDTSIPGMRGHRTRELMGPTKSWAAVFTSVDVETRDDPHPASAAVRLDEVSFVSSILPWRSCGPAWEGATLGEKMQFALSTLRPHIDGQTVWGGDWNQALKGSDHVGSLSGRAEVVAVIEAAGLSVPTADLSSAVADHPAIDHIAVPRSWDVTAAYRVPAERDGRRLSDHDAYVISVSH